jgi:RimJ/RimL family protein N-acetyltransferase
METLITDIPALTLKAPDPERDAPFAVQWFTSPDGHETLQLMGNAEKDITPSTLEKEQEILTDFLQLEKEGKQLTWMMRSNDKTVGAIWVELAAQPVIPSPAISIMIGDQAMRGKGVGGAAMRAVIAYLQATTTYSKLYARHLVTNHASAHMLAGLGFMPIGASYIDPNGLTFQNRVLELA